MNDLVLQRYLAVGAIIFVIAMVSPRGMGFGDVKLALLMGLYLGWLHPILPLFAVLAASLLGSVAGVFVDRWEYREWDRRIRPGDIVLSHFRGESDWNGTMPDMIRRFLNLVTAEGYAVLKYSTRGFGDSWGQVNMADLNAEIAHTRTEAIHFPW